MSFTCAAGLVILFSYCFVWFSDFGAKEIGGKPPTSGSSKGLLIEDSTHVNII